MKAIIICVQKDRDYASMHDGRSAYADRAIYPELLSQLLFQDEIVLIRHAII